MEAGDVFAFPLGLITVRKVIAAILLLPLLTMLILLPFFQYLSKGIKEWLSNAGYLGMMADGDLAVEGPYRTLGARMLTCFQNDRPSASSRSLSSRLILPRSSIL